MKTPLAFKCSRLTVVTGVIKSADEVTPPLPPTLQLRGQVHAGAEGAAKHALSHEHALSGMPRAIAPTAGQTTDERLAVAAAGPAASAHSKHDRNAGRSAAVDTRRMPVGGMRQQRRAGAGAVAWADALLLTAKAGGRAVAAVAARESPVCAV